MTFGYPLSIGMSESNESNKKIMGMTKRWDPSVVRETLPQGDGERQRHPWMFLLEIKKVIVTFNVNGNPYFF